MGEGRAGQQRGGDQGEAKEGGAHGRLSGIERLGGEPALHGGQAIDQTQAAVAELCVPPVRGS